MKLGIFSDLHLEFGVPWDYRPEPGVFYLNAGDTHPNTGERHKFAERFGEDYLQVMGNHDYYGSSFKDADLDVEYASVQGVKIAGATLWTYISPQRWWDFKEYMVDSRQVKGMNYDKYMRTHRHQCDYLFNSEADVWVVHHLPSYQSIHPKYKDSGGNDFFATELSEKILDMKKPPRLIVHGHTHERCDYMIGETRVVCNPRGYPNETPWFNAYEPLIVEV